MSEAGIEMISPYFSRKSLKNANSRDKNENQAEF
jgi:hypothetical protein